jgi:hypothetical protein
MGHIAVIPAVLAYSAGYMEMSSFNILHFEQKCFPRGDSEFGLCDSLSRKEYLGCCL